MSASPPAAASTRGWPSCNSKPARSRPPGHLLNRRTRARVDVGSGDDEAMLLVEPDGTAVVRIDGEIESCGREPLGFGEQRASDLRTPRLRCNHDLIEIPGLGVDGHEAD